MKYLSLIIAICVLSCFPSLAQTTYINEDFASAVVTTPPTGWTQQVFTGNANVDLWHFDNPGNRILNAPISNPAAIFDSDTYSNNSLAENVALETPAFDASAATTVWLELDHYFNGGSNGTFNIQVFDGSSWITVLSGNTDTPNPQHLQLDISAEAAGNAQAKVRFRWTGNWSFWWIVDNVKIFQPLSTDAGVVAITNPTSSCFLGQENITVDIQNFGSDTISNFSVKYIVNPGGTVINETYTGTPIPPGQTDSYTFATQADLSAIASFDIKAYTALASDTNTSNDTSSASITHVAPVSAPFSEDMESFIVGSPGTFMNGWTNQTGNDIDWRVHAGSTSSSNTGPATDHTIGLNTGKYLYTEASGGNLGDVAELLSPCIDLSQMTGPGLSFWYHMFGPTMGTLEVDIISDAGVSTLFSLSGQQQTSAVEAWREGTINLTAYSGQVIQLQFRGIRGIDLNSDMALDDIALVELPDTDLGISAIIHPIPNACYSQNEKVTVELTNYSFQTINFASKNATIQLSINGPTPGAHNITLSTGTLQPGESRRYTVTTTADMSSPGNYTLKAHSVVSGDGLASNDTTSTNFDQPSISLSSPFIEDMESGTTGAPGVLPNGWVQLNSDDDDWRVNSGPTTTTLTGPLVDHTSQTSSGKYLYVEATNSAAGDVVELLSPCIDLSGVSNPALSFWYHMYGDGIGTLEVDVLQSDTAITVFSISGQQQSGNSDDWLEGFANLAGMDTQIRLRFRAIKTNMFNGDISLDDIGIFDIVSTDLELTKVISPKAAVCSDSLASVTVQITNNGAVTYDFSQEALVLTAEFSGSNNLTLTDTLDSGQLAFQQSMDFSFGQAANLVNVGNTQMKVWFNPVTGDNIFSNDTTQESINIIPKVSAFPYVEVFESGQAGWTPGGTLSSWALGTPNKLFIKGTASGKNSWVTGGLGLTFYNPGENSWVSSPCFDLTQAPADLWISMSIWWESEFSFDGAVLQGSTDEGQTWFNVGNLNDPFNWFNDGTITGNPGGQQIGWTGRASTGDGSNGWVKAVHPIPDSLKHVPSLRFRVAFGSDMSVEVDGFAFDDFALATPPDVNLGPDSSIVCINQQLDAGFPGSTYLWSTGATTQRITISNPTGTTIRDSLFYVTVTDSLGLMGRDSIYITIPALPLTVQASATSDNVCFNDSTGAATAIASGNGKLSYQWNTVPPVFTPSVSGLGTGTFTVTVTDELGCVETADVTISSAPEILVEVDSITSTFCEDDELGAISITVSGGKGANYTISWDNGKSGEIITGLSSGNYTATITDSIGCTTTADPIFVDAEPGRPDASFVVVDTVGASLVFMNTSTGTDSTSTYSWNFGNGKTSQEENPSMYFGINTTFEVTLIVTNQCGADTVTKTIEIITTDIAGDLQKAISLYPNPSNGSFELAFDQIQLEDVSVAVLGVNGQRFFVENIGDVSGMRKHKLNLAGQLSRGVYMLRIRSRQGEIYKRMVIQ